MPTFPSSSGYFIFAFLMYSHENHSSFGLRTVLLSLDRLDILSPSRRSWVGTCIQRQLNVPVLICR